MTAWLWVALARAAGCDAPTPEAASTALRCWYDEARSTGDYAPATARVRGWLGEHPGEPWGQFTMANLLTDQGQVPEAIPLYESAIAGFDAAGDRDGQVRARLNLCTYLADAWRFDDIDRLVQEATRLAAGDAELSARARAQKARLQWRAGRDLGAARADLQALLNEMGEGGDYQTRLIALHTLFSIAEHTGDLEEASYWLDRTEQHTTSHGDVYVAATVWSHRLRLLMESPIRDLGKVRALVPEVLRASEEGGNPYVAMEARCAAAWLTPWPESRGAWEACLAEVDAEGDPEQGPAWRIWQIDAIGDPEPELAARLLAEADHAIDDWALDDWGPVVASRRARLALAAGRSDDAWQAVTQLLDHLQAMSRTSDPASRGAVLYQNLDLLYEPAERYARSSGGEDRALQLVETLRGSNFDEASRASWLVPVDADTLRRRTELDAAHEELWEAEGGARAEVLRRIASLQQELRRADEDAWKVAHHGVSADPIPTFAAVRAVLGPDEAVWMAQLPLGSGPAERLPPAWSWTVTSAGARRDPLPPRWELAPRVNALVAAIRDRTGAEVGPDAALGADLLAPSRAGWESARHLIVVPDGPLHGLPLAALPELWDGQRSRPVSVVPSARHLLAVRAAPPPPKRSVVLAGPSVPGLPPLPAAESEADAALDAVPGRRLAAAGATEAALRAALEDPTVGWVHVAAHAEVDAMFPERSRILLAEGDGQDGVLTLAELARLRVPGQGVVLSGCGTAEGRVIGGEGPLGLARALLDAGARVVVATAWPMRDDDTAAFFEVFYRALAEGDDVATAAAAARDERRGTGAPAEAWAGVLVIGDGTTRFTPASSRWPLPVAAGAGVVTLLGVAGWQRRRGRSAGSAPPPKVGRGP